MFGYRVPDPDEAMLISGRKSRSDNTPFRVVTGTARSSCRSFGGHDS